MCIVIDTNCLSLVFNRENTGHADFRPVLSWIVEGRGKAVYGGTKYLTELGRAIRYLRVFGELKKAGKAIEIDRAKVDEHQARISRIMDTAKHNDPHLPAIVSASNCRLICTQDDRSHRLLKESTCYPKGVAVPKIYNSASHTELLCDENIVDACKPVVVLNREQREALRLGDANV